MTWTRRAAEFRRNHGDGLRQLAHQTRQVLLLAGVTGAATGLVVAVFDRLTADVLLDAVVRAPLAVQVVAPLLG
ncbi:MAG TPA: hypothetical protein VHD87_12290, partial [Acidimicrobiales bacterium]|nr:hypothetical protein [Acidimicrobiales bacterium]